MVGGRPCLRRWRSSFGPRCAGYGVAALASPARPPSQSWPYSLRSHGDYVVLPPVVLHAHFWSVREVASAPDVRRWVAGQRQLLPPAGTSLGKWTGCQAAVRGGRVWGGVLPSAGHLRRSGTCRGCNRRRLPLLLASTARRLHPRQNPDRATPARPREEPHPITRPPRTPARQPVHFPREVPAGGSS